MTFPWIATERLMQQCGSNDDKSKSARVMVVTGVSGVVDGQAIASIVLYGK